MSTSRRAWKSSTFVFLVLFLSLSLSGFAQSGKGTISGHVVDASGAVLQGARIELQPKGISVVSNGHGEFELTGLAAGGYKLTVSYLGFQTFEKQVTLEAGQAMRLDTRLDVASKNETVIVTAERVFGEVEAINRTKNADNIVQVLPAEVITSLPNANMADAIGRMPSVTLERDEGEGKYIQIRGTEPRLTNVTINGNTIPSPEGGVRQIKLDAVASDLVESVELNKTLTAKQDGDGIGGSVNFVTKKAGETPTFTIGGLGGFTPIEGGRTVNQFGSTIGKRFGATKKFGLLFGGTYDFNGRGIDDIEPGWNSPVSGNTPTYKSLSTREYKYYRSRYGFTGGADYRLSDTSNIYMNGMFSDFFDYGDKWYYSYTNAGAPKFYTSSRRPEFGVGSIDAGGHHAIGAGLLNWDISSSYSYMNHAAGNPKADFAWLPPASAGLPAKINYTIDQTTNPMRPQFTPTNATLAQIQDPANWTLLDAQTSDGKASGLTLSAQGDYARPYHIAGHWATFEIGGKIRNTHRGQDAMQAVYDLPGAKPVTDPRYTMTNFLGNFTNNNYYDNSYKLGPVSDFTIIQKNGLPLLNYDYPATLTNSAAANYDLIERVSAGYMMNTVNFGRFSLQTGLRFENTTLDTVGYLVQNGTTNAPTQVLRNTSYLDPLPSAQLKFAITKDAAIRAVYSRGIARPNPLDTIPYVKETDTASNAYAGTISVGNQNLKAEHANNYDLLFEYYLKPVGMIQAGVFYKDLTDPIFTAQSGVMYAPPGQSTALSYLQTQPINGTSAWVSGFETAYQHRLSFLPSSLRGMGISTNYSYTRSEARGIPYTYYDSSKNAVMIYRTAPLLRQAPHSWNISPTYDRGRVSIRVGMQYNSAYIFQYTTSTDPRLTDITGLTGPNGDDHVYAHTQIDAQGSVRLYRGLNFTAYGLNLTNEPFGHYQGSPQYMIQREFYKPTYAFGLKYSLGGEK